MNYHRLEAVPWLPWLSRWEDQVLGRPASGTITNWKQCHGFRGFHVARTGSWMGLPQELSQIGSSAMAPMASTRVCASRLVSATDCVVPMSSESGTRKTVKTKFWEGYHESRRCSLDTLPESYITKNTGLRRQTQI